jgi:hypothetical protein
MTISSLSKYALGAVAAAGILAGCSNGGQAGGLGASGVTPGMDAGHLTRALMRNGVLITAEHPAPLRQSPVSPDKKKHHKKKADQYITDFDTSSAFEFDYPKSDASIGSISNLTNAQGECTKNGKKTFWVTATGSEAIDEFNVGGSSPISTLSVSAEGDPAGCAVDPTTGNLAATIITNGDVVVFADAAGSGTTYSSGLIEAFFATYDKSGNLFVDGFNADDGVGVVELTKGSSAFKTISLSNAVEFPGNIQWDGTYVTVNDQDAHDIFQYTVSGTTGTLKGTVSLGGSSDCDQTWIAKNLVYCPDAGAADGKVYKYPAGGSSPLATLTGGFEEPIGAVSVAK